MNIILDNSIATAMNTYNKTYHGYFIVTDFLVLSAIASGTYTTDNDLARRTMTSERTIKRSINKLCEFGILEKHIIQNHIKTLTMNQAALNAFINQHGDDA